MIKQIEKVKEKCSSFGCWSDAKLSALVVIGLASITSAQAAAVDVSAVTADIAAQAAPIGLIGAAVLLIFVGVKAFKWVRAALS